MRNWHLAVLHYSRLLVMVYDLLEFKLFAVVLCLLQLALLWLV